MENNNLFFYLEKATFKVILNEISDTNNLIIKFNTKHNNLILKTFSKNCLSNLNYCIDNDIITKTNRSGLEKLNYHVLYNCNKKLKTILMSNVFINSAQSNEAVYLNLDWIERESLEKNNLLFYSKLDSRNLLFNYTTKENIFLKKLNSANTTFDIFYNTKLNDLDLTYNCQVEA